MRAGPGGWDEGCGGIGALPPPATPHPAGIAERGLPATPIQFAAQARAAPEVLVFGARRLPTPAAQGPLNLLWAQAQGNLSTQLPQHLSGAQTHQKPGRQGRWSASATPLCTTDAPL